MFNNKRLFLGEEQQSERLHRRRKINFERIQKVFQRSQG
jgi:hypothetical protein